LLNDLVDQARPGDEVEITGIYISKFDYNMNVQHGFPIFATYIEANNIKRLHDIDQIELTEDEVSTIWELSRKGISGSGTGGNSNIANDIINSIAPGIYGHKYIKTAIALAMFGGEAKDISGKHKVRGDINVLLLGDPGVAKS